MKKTCKSCTTSINVTVIENPSGYCSDCITENFRDITDTTCQRCLVYKESIGNTLGFCEDCMEEVENNALDSLDSNDDLKGACQKCQSEPVSQNNTLGLCDDCMEEFSEEFQMDAQREAEYQNKQARKEYITKCLEILKENKTDNMWDLTIENVIGIWIKRETENKTFEWINVFDEIYDAPRRLKVYFDQHLHYNCRHRFYFDPVNSKNEELKGYNWNPEIYVQFLNLKTPIELGN